MLTTAALVAALLLILGGLLTRLLHFSPGALGVASGIILLIIAATMVLSQGNGTGGGNGGGHGGVAHVGVAHVGVAHVGGAHGGGHQIIGRDPMQVAVFPLAVPYLLNPAGIVVLVTLSAEASSLAVVGAAVGVLVVVLVFDVVVFRWATAVSSKLDASRMLVTEKVFGFLLAALGVQLVLNGLADVGVIHLTGH
jgi:multiple antibiotic resistance protein